MDDYRDAIASCCRQLRLSANLADNALAIEGETHQEYLYNLLSKGGHFSIIAFAFLWQRVYSIH